MIQEKCIQKFRDKQNKIIGYRLIDTNGKTQDITSENLKRAIANNQIHVVNIKLTSDNRLVDTQPAVPKQPTVSNTTLEQKIQAALAKAALIDLSTPEVLYKLACQAGFQNIIELSKTDCKGRDAELNTHFKNYKDAIQHPEATIFITNMSQLFKGCQEQTLDISNFNTSNVTNMGDIFYRHRAKIKATDPEILIASTEIEEI